MLWAMSASLHPTSKRFSMIGQIELMTLVIIELFGLYMGFS